MGSDLTRDGGRSVCAHERKRDDRRKSSFSVRVLARVSGPQPGVRLAHRAEDLLHVARPHRSMAGRDGTTAQVLGKELEHGDRVGWECVGIDVSGVAEQGRQSSGSTGGEGPLCRNS